VCYDQASRQDVAAEGPKTRKGGHIFKIQFWMYAATGGPNVKWEGTNFKWGVRASLAHPLATTLGITLEYSNLLNAGQATNIILHSINTVCNN